MSLTLTDKSRKWSPDDGVSRKVVSMSPVNVVVERKIKVIYLFYFIILLLLLLLLFDPATVRTLLLLKDLSRDLVDDKWSYTKSVPYRGLASKYDAPSRVPLEQMKKRRKFKQPVLNS